jgi:hypothetical protein
MGPEEIVYGDKVINLVNTDPGLPWNRHRRVFPEKESPYLANGEIGMAEGSSRGTRQTTSCRTRKAEAHVGH